VVIVVRRALTFVVAKPGSTDAGSVGADALRKPQWLHAGGLKVCKLQTCPKNTSQTPHWLHASGSWVWKLHWVVKPASHRHEAGGELCLVLAFL